MTAFALTRVGWDVWACPFLAPNGHAAVVDACPLLRDERT
jgi:hypothetical protein